MRRKGINYDTGFTRLGAPSSREVFDPAAGAARDRDHRTRPALHGSTHLGQRSTSGLRSPPKSHLGRALRSGSRHSRAI